MNFKTWNMQPYATIVTSYKFYESYDISYNIARRNKKILCGRVTSQKILTRAVRRKQSYFFGLSLTYDIDTH